MSRSKTSNKDHQQATTKIIVAVSDAGVAAHGMLRRVCGEIRRRKLLKMTASDGTSFTVYEYTIPSDRLRAALLYLPGTTGVLTCHSPVGRSCYGNTSEDKLGPGAAALLAGRSSETNMCYAREFDSGRTCAVHREICEWCRCSAHLPNNRRE